MPMNAIHDYAYGLGSNVALASLHNVENHLYPTNRWRAGDTLWRVGIHSMPVNIYPVREMSLDNYEHGDGEITHFWMLTLRAQALAYYLNELFSYPSSPVSSVAVTINTRREELGSYTRYNCYAHLPTFGDDGDVQALRMGAFIVRQRFSGLEAAS